MNVDAFHIVPLNLGKGVLDDVWTFSDVCSPYARIYYIVSGTALLEMQGQNYALGPTNLYLIPPFVKFTITFQGNFVHYYIHAYEDATAEMGLFESYDFPLEVNALSSDERLFERLVELNPNLVLPCPDPKDYDRKELIAQTIMRNQQIPDWVKMESHGIALQLYARFMEKATVKPYVSDERIMKAISYVRNHLDKPIPLQQLADELELSEGHFIRLFKQATGMSPKLYVNMKRIERAQHLLHTTNQSVKDIGFSLGYPDDSYFVRAFKRIIGMTPVEYRNYFMRESDTE